MYGYYSHSKRGRYDQATLVPPTFSERLTSKEVREGESIRFTVRVAGKPPPEITWYREGSQIVSSPDFEVQQDGDVHALYIPEVFYEDSGKFTVKAENRAGQTSCTAELIVEAPAPLAPPPPPLQPETVPVFQVTLTNQPLYPGQTAYFECKVAAHPPPEILWTRRGHPLVDKARYKSTYDQYSGVTTLTILNLCSEDEGEYTCTAINSQGETSTSALLLGPDRYQAWLQEQGKLPQKGKPQNGMMSELQTKLDAPRDSGDFYRPMSERAIDHALEQQVPIYDKKPEEGFKVSSFEKRLVDEVEYREGRLHPKHHIRDEEAYDVSVPTTQASAPVFEQKLKNFKLMEGSDATFVCKVTGHPRPHIQWYHNGRLIRPSNRYEIKMTRDGYVTLRIRVAFPEDHGHYTCCATNIIGRDTCSAELYIEGIGIIDETSYISEASLRRMTQSPSRRGSQEPGGVSEKYYRPVFRKIPADQDVPEGKVCRFDSVVTGRPMPEILWFRDDTQVHDDGNHKIVVNEDGIHSLIIHATQTWDAGLYTCIAKNRGGEDRFQVRLNVTARQATQPPRFVERMMNQTVKEGQPVEFHAEATGYPTPMMSWQKDGRHVDQDRHFLVSTEGGRSRLEIAVAEVKDTAWYQCTAINNGGTATNRARLMVQPEPRKPEPERKLYIPKRTTPTPALYKSRMSPSPGARSPTPTLAQPRRRTLSDIHLYEDPIGYRDAQQRGLIQVITRGHKSQSTEHLPLASQYSQERIIPTPPPMAPMELPPRQPTPSSPIPPQMELEPPWAEKPTRYKSILTPPPKPSRPPLVAAELAKTAEFEFELPKLKPVKRPADMEPEEMEPPPTARRTRDITSPKPPDAKRPSSEPPKRARAEIVLSPTPPPRDGSIPWRNVQAPESRSPLFDEPMQQEVAPPVAAPAPPPAAPPKPQKSDLVKYIQEQEKEKPTPDFVDARPLRAPEYHMPPKDMPTPSEEDMFNRENPQPPRFKTQIKPQTRLMESEPAHFECRLVPINDPDMVVEWYKDGVLLKHGTRFNLIHDFGYVALDFQWCYPEDSGTYSCKATNKYGQDMTQTELKCHPKESVIYDTQLPEGDESVQHLHIMEEQIRRDNMRKERIEEGPEPAPPVFDLMPESLQVEEGETAKFMCKVSGHPRPRLTWWVNGAIIVNGHRFRLKYDGMINVLEIPKVREYDNGTIRVVAKNPLGEAECSTTLVVIPHEDWRSRLKQAPKSTVEVELDKRKGVELRSYELDSALKKPRTTVTELRAFERSAQERAQAYRDTEVSEAYHTINLRHAELRETDASRELRGHEPNIHIESEIHIDRAKYMLGLEAERDRKTDVPRIPKSGKTQEPPTFSRPLMNSTTKEGQIVKMEVNFTGFPYPDVQWFREGLEIQPSRDFQITTLNNKSFLLIPEVFLEDAGIFTVKISNVFGMAECKCTLKVTEDTLKVRDSAPEFKVQMRDIMIRVGEPATFDVQISGHPKPDVYWAKDGKRLYESKRWKFIIEEDRFTLLIYEVGVEDSGVYECIMVNKLGKATCTARLNVDGQAAMSKSPTTAGQQAPQLVQPLKDQLVNEGESATFTCQIQAVPEPIVQWYYNNQLVKPSKYFQMYSENGNHSLHIAGAFPEDEGLYKCTARNQAGEVTCIAHLKVFALSSEPEPEIYKTTEPPKFTKPIHSVEGKPGHPAHFVVEFEGQAEVTWYREGHQILHSEDFQILQEGNKCVLFIKEVFPEDSGIFTCRATNPTGVAECSAELYVEDPTQISQAKVQLQQQKAPPKTAPRVLKAPSPVREVVTGNTTKLIVQLAAYPPPKFMWLHDGRQLAPDQRYKVTYEEGIVTLIIFNVQPQDAGDYILKATNELGETTCKTTLNIKPTEKVVELPTGTQQVYITSKKKPEKFTMQTEITPTFTKPLQPEIRVRERAIAKMEAYVEAYPQPIITWHVNGTQIKPSPKYTVKHEGNKAILLVKNVTIEDAGLYSCRAVSDLGEAVSSTTLYVTGAQPRAQPPKFVVPLRDVTGTDGKEVTFTCTVKGTPAPEIFWFHNDKSIDKNEDFVISYNRQTGKVDLVIVDCLPEDQGVFKCVARNQAGQDVTQATLTVTQPQAEIIQPEKAAPPQKARLVVQKGDKEVIRSAVESEIDRTLHQKEVKVIKRIVKKQSGQPPKFSKPIQPQVVKEAENAVFTAVVSGAPQPEIVWLKDKVPLRPGPKHIMEFDTETGTCTLTILNGQPSDVGVYSCRAENPAGKATCTANVVVVHPDKDYGLQPDIHMIPPSFKQSLKPVQVKVGETAVFHCHINGKPMPSLVWFHNGNKIKLNERVQLKFGRQSGKWELHILNAIPDDSGMFRCVALNPRGEASAEANLEVVGTLRHGVGDSSKIQYVVEMDEPQPEEPQRRVYIFKEPPLITESIISSTENEIIKRNEEIDEFRKLPKKFPREFEVEEATTTETNVRSEREVAIEKFDGKKSYEKNVWEHSTTLEEKCEPNITGEIGEEGDLVLPVEEGPVSEVTGTMAIEGGDISNIELLEIDMNKLGQKEFPKEGKLSHATRATSGATKAETKPTTTVTRTGKDGKTVIVETVTTGGKESAAKTVTRTTQKDVQWKMSDDKEVLELTHEQIKELMERGKNGQRALQEGVPIEVQHEDEIGESQPQNNPADHADKVTSPEKVERKVPPHKEAPVELVEEKILPTPEQDVQMVPQEAPHVEAEVPVPMEQTVQDETLVDKSEVVDIDFKPSSLTHIPDITLPVAGIAPADETAVSMETHSVVETKETVSSGDIESITMDVSGQATAFTDSQTIVTTVAGIGPADVSETITTKTVTIETSSDKGPADIQSQTIVTTVAGIGPSITTESVTTETVTATTVVSSESTS